MHYSHTTAGVICFSRFASLSLSVSQVAQLPRMHYLLSRRVYIHILSLLRAKELSLALTKREKCYE